MTDNSANPSSQRIVIVGSGIAAWMAAVALAKAVKAGDWSICVVRDETADSLSPAFAADATMPLSRSPHFALDMDEDAVIAETGAAFSCGIALSGWSGAGAAYFNPFGTVGAALGPVPFHHLVMRLRREGLPLRLANYSLAALAAQSGRFCRPSRDAHSVLSTCDYGLHMVCAKVAELLSAEARRRGVACVAAPMRTAERKGDGSVAAIVTAGGKRIEGDWFIDCTGPEGRLMEGAGWEDWSPWLPCDSFVAARVPARDAPPPYSLAAATPAGWVREVPTQGANWTTGFHSSRFSTPEEALETIRHGAGQSSPEDVVSGRLRFGRRTRAWQGNCIALGGAAATIDPVAASNLHLTRSSIDRVLRLLPARPGANAEAEEYNRLTAQQLDHARDFAILHYKLNGRRGEPFWDECRSMALPGTLEYKLRSYESRGRVPLYDEEPLEEASWLNLFDEHGVRPRRYSPLANGFGIAELQAHVERVRVIMLDELKKMPMHGDYLARVQRKSGGGMSG